MRDPYRYTSLITFGIYARPFRMVKRVAFSSSTWKLNSRDAKLLAILSAARICMFAFYDLNTEGSPFNIIKMPRQGSKGENAKKTSLVRVRLSYDVFHGGKTGSCSTRACPAASAKQMRRLTAAGISADLWK